MNKVIKLIHKRQKRNQNFAQGFLKSFIKGKQSNMTYIKKLIFLSLIALFINQTSAISQNTTKEQTKTATVEPVLIWEKTFDEPIVDVIFSEAEMRVKEARALGVKGLEKKVATETVKVQYPKVTFIPRIIVTNPNEIQIKEIKFYNKKGNIVKSIPITKWSDKVIKSLQGKYIAISRNPTEYDLKNIGGSLYKNDGTLIWRIDDGPSPVTVNDKGYVVATYLDWGPYGPGDFVFYNPSGNEIGRIKNPLLEEGYECCGGSAKFTEDGEYVVLGFDIATKSIIILATKEGKILWKREIDYQTYAPFEMDVIENIGLVGICDQYKPSYQTYAYFIDWNGNLKWMVPLNTRGNIIVKFKKDKKKVIVCSSRGYLFCIDIFSGKILWQHKEKWAQTGVVASHPPHKPLFDEVAIDKNYIYVKGSYENEEQEWYNSALLIFNIDNGQLIQRKEYINKRIFLRTLKDKIFTIDIDNRTVKQFKME